MNKLVVFFLFFVAVPNVVVAQERIRKNVKGKVTAATSELEGIRITNLQSKAETPTSKDGTFSITAAVGDTLKIASMLFKTQKILLAQEDFNREIIIRLEPMMHQLMEVKVIQYPNINAVALGIIPKNQKKYTPAERKLKTASATDATIGLNTSMMLDPIWNALSGRTAMLRKELIVERREFLLQKIERLFDEEFFINKLKIPAEYVKGFQYYSIENSRFVATLNAGNITLATFIMGELASNYLELISNENK
jgi:hypothetical protein